MRHSFRVSLAIAGVVGSLGCGLETSPAAGDPGKTESTTSALVSAAHGGCPLLVPHAESVSVKLSESLMVQYPAYMDYETGVIKKGWEYTNGVLLYGLQKLGAVTQDPRYLDYVKPYVDRYVQTDGTILYLQGDGVSTRDKRILDVIQPSILLFSLFDAYPGSTQYLAAMKNTRDIYPTIQTNSFGGYFHKPTYPYQMWLDGEYMAQPFLSRFGTEHADTFDPSGADAAASHDAASYQLILIADKTQVPKKNLYCHAWLDWAGIDAYNAGNPNPYAIPAWPDPVTGQSPEIWSRALGWYSMAVVDVLEVLPPQHPSRRQLIDIIRNIALGLERYQDPDTGLWSQVVDKPGAPGNYLETSGSAMFVYALAKASRSGDIPGVYHKVAEKGWEGVKSRVVFNADGTFTVKGAVGGMGVLNNYAAYVAVKTVDNSPQGIAAVVLASIEMEFHPMGCQLGLSAP
jgi:unsaturated rhamnogalacturonyl hydrolase